MVSYEHKIVTDSDPGKMEKRLDGYEVARLLRQQPALRGVVLVALTGWGQDEGKRRSQEAVFDVHLTKPVDLQELQQGYRPMPILFNQDDHYDFDKPANNFTAA